MKKHTLAIIYFVLIWCTSGCHKPEELLPPAARNGINSITVSFPDGSGSFTALVPEEGSEIIVDIPYYFPENSNNQVTESMIKRMKAKANLDDNVVIEPGLVTLDLSTTTVITVVDQRKERKEYAIKGNIKKSSASSITDFRLPNLGLSGVINETESIIYLISADDLLTPELAELTMSFHATISPDPRNTPLSYESDQQLTVTAHDGVTSRIYTVKKAIPEKIPYGIRSGSARLLFAKQLTADLEIAPGVTRGISVSGDYLVLNSSGYNSVYIDALTGEKKGEMNLGSIKGAEINYYATSDDGGNILICNRASSGTTFNIWKVNSVTGTPEVLINYPATNNMGNRFSVNGNVDGDAIITAPFRGVGSLKFVRWKISGGVSSTPEIVEIGGLTAGWNNSGDIISTSSTDPNADYFAYVYSNYFSWIDGMTNMSKPGSRLHFNNNNFVANSIDLKAFNNANYIAIDWTNTQTFGGGDRVFLLDATDPSKLTGNLEATGAVEPLVWRSDNTYGARAINTSNKGSSSDVYMRVSDNGYYLYVYFVFTDGYVVGYQFDCIKM